MARSKNEQLPEEGQDTVMVGNVYKEKGDANNEVIPFFVDMHSAEVRFSPVGRSAEDRMRSSDFLNRFEDTGSNRASSSEELKSKEQSLKDNAE